MKAEQSQTLKIYQVDAFSDQLFKGNPAAVVPLQKWLPDATMQSIALENNLSETAFFTQNGEDFELRWFTPKVEVDLCGHATLAAARVIFDEFEIAGNTIQFYTKSGVLSVQQNGDFLTLNFPTDQLQALDEAPLEIVYGLGLTPLEVYKGRFDMLAVLKDEEDVKKVNPDLGILSKIPVRGVIITAAGKEVDFVSRFFGPNCGVNEDAVTGSAHTSLTPFWAARLGKNTLTARQLSERGGSLRCELKGNRVEISGQTKLYMKGTLFLY